ncbi:MAG: type VI secretion system tip protein TssI/VgrG [Pseudomonadota bacterium]
MVATRDVVVDNKLGNAFAFRHMAGREALSELFEYRIELLSEDDGIKLEEVLGSTLMLTMSLQGGATRYLHGHVVQFAYAGTDGSYACYHARVQPWLWFLSTTEDCRIFQEMSAPDIITEIFGKYSVANYTFKLNEDHPVRNYCVQYNENDLNFIKRLCEDDGIFFYFEHSNGEHKLVFCDDNQSYMQRPGYETVPYYSRDDQSRRERDHLYDWRSILDVRPGRFIHTSFDFERPRAELEARRLSPMQHAQSEGEIYSYPACYTDIGRGEHLARVRLEQNQATHKRMRGAGTVAGLSSGQTFSLTNYPRKDQNEHYVVIAVEHEIWADAYRSSSSNGDEEPYLCTIEVQPAAVPFRPPAVTPKPVMAGPESAIVTGPPSEEIWTDQYGRVKVQFPWDRLGQNNEKSSCWIRVSQAWAGSGFGSIQIPRIGQEVLVEFLQGDVDRPIITGRVYNGNNMPPYDLPAGATQSGLKSNSSKGGGGSNELRFEDKKDHEEAFFHAQKDYNAVVENDKTETVKNNETITIEASRTETVKGTETLGVDADRTRTVGGAETVTVTGDQTATVNGSRTRDVGGTETITITGAQSVDVSGGRDVKIKNNDTLDVSGNREITSKATYKVTATQVEIIGTTQISLTVGGSYIKIDPSGITIFGPMLKLN